MILKEKYNGHSIHRFVFSGCVVYVTRGKRSCAVLDRDHHGLFIAVIAPPGMSYHQAALEAVAALEAGRFRYKEEA